MVGAAGMKTSFVGSENSLSSWARCASAAFLGLDEDDEETAAGEGEGR